MKFGRLHVGITRYPDGRYYFTWVEFEHAICGCYIFEFLGICVTWFGDECYYADKSEED